VERDSAYRNRGNLALESITDVIGDKPTLSKNDSIHEFEQLMKSRIIAHTAESDFDLSRVFIGVTTFKQFGGKRAVDHLSPENRTQWRKPRVRS
jgi:hypothetical protein